MATSFGLRSKELKPSPAMKLQENHSLTVRTSLLGLSGKANGQARSEINSKAADFRASERLVQLKLTAEKMVQEQACVKADLQATHSKLENSEREVRKLETRLQETMSENAVLKVKQQESLKLWEGLDSKFASTKTFCDQLAETLQQLSVQVLEAEQERGTLQQKIEERFKFYQEMRLQIEDLASKKEHAESIADNWKKEYTELKHLHEQLNESMAKQLDRIMELEQEKVEITRSSQDLLQDERKKLKFTQQQLDRVQCELSGKASELMEMQRSYACLLNSKQEIDFHVKDLEAKLALEVETADKLRQETKMFLTKLKQFEETNAVMSEGLRKLSLEMESLKEQLEEEHCAKEQACKELDDLNARHRDLAQDKHSLNVQHEELKEELLDLKKLHDCVQKESSYKIEVLLEEASHAHERFQDVLKEKGELENQVAVLDQRIASLLLMMEELGKNKNDLSAENLHLKAEIETINEDTKRIIQEKLDEMESFSKKTTEITELLSLREAELSQLHHTCTEHEKTIAKLADEQKCLVEQNAEISIQKAAAERLGQEAHRQAEVQIEMKQMELNRHLKEISERNDQEMNEIRKKYESETKEAILKEEQKSKAVCERMQTDCEMQITKAREEERNIHEAQLRDLLQLQEKERNLASSQFNEELKRKHDLIQQLENEKLALRQTWESTLLEVQKKHAEEMKKHRATESSQYSKVEERASNMEEQLNSLKKQLRDEKLKREEDLKASKLKYEEALQKCERDSKVLEEDHRRSLLTVQMTHQRELEEMRTKVQLWEAKCKNLEKLDINVVNPGRELVLAEQGSSPTNQLFVPAKCTKESTSMKDGRTIESVADKGKSNTVGLPRHSKTITHHEYEVATSDGKKTITRRKRTKSTVMFEGRSSPLNIKHTASRKSPRILSQQSKKPSHAVYATTMGDLFGGKSLDPYADDPYAFN